MTHTREISTKGDSSDAAIISIWVFCMVQILGFDSITAHYVEIYSVSVVFCILRAFWQKIPKNFASSVVTDAAQIFGFARKSGIATEIHILATYIELAR